MPVVQYIEAVPREFVRHNVLSATVRIYVGRHVVRRQDLVDVLRELEADIQNVYRMEKPYEWFATFVNEKAAEQFCQQHEEVAYAGGSLYLSMLNKQVVSVRVHWVPDYFDQDFLERIVRQWGRIRSVEVSHNMFRFELEVSLEGAHEVPHVLVLPDGKRFLVTMPGRLSMCLKCGDLGHIRSSCGRVQSRPVPVIETQTAQIETQTDVSCVSCSQIETQTDVTCFGSVSQCIQVDLPAPTPVKQGTVTDSVTQVASVKQVKSGKSTDKQKSDKLEPLVRPSAEARAKLWAETEEWERKRELERRKKMEDRERERREREQEREMEQERVYMKRRSEIDSGQMPEVVKSGRWNMDYQMSDSDGERSPNRRFLDEKYDYHPRVAHSQYK